MARIAGIDLPKEKRGEIGLTYIFGIGPKTSRLILDAARVDYDTNVSDCTDAQVSAIRKSN
jgi:Ribosomal protein S13